MHKESWVFLTEAYNETEANVICGFLQTHEIPTQKEFHGPFSGLRVIMGEEIGVSIMVPEELLPRARALLAEIDED